MIVLANEEFAIGLRLAGVKKSYAIFETKQCEDILENVDRSEFIITTQNVLKICPKINNYPNVIVFPDTIQDFSSVDDLKQITKLAIGSEVEI